MAGGAPLSDWIWLGSGWGMVALGVGAMAWALCWDRARGRKRCRSCWYDMQGVGLMCPECGRAAKSERELTRTRRRWWWGVAAVALGLAGVQVMQQGDRADEGWTRVVPTSVLVLLVGPKVDVRKPGVGHALITRKVRGWQRAVAEWRTLAMDAGNAGNLVQTREKWPMGVPPLVRMGFDPGAVPRLGFWEVVVELEGHPELSASRPLDPPYLLVDRFGMVKDSFRLPARPVGVYTDAFVVRVKTGGWTIGRWRVERRCEIVRTIEDAMPAADSAEVTAAVRAGLRMISFADEVFEVNCYGVFDKSTRDHGVQLTGEVLVDGVVAARLDESQSFRVSEEGEDAASKSESTIVVPRGMEWAVFVRDHVRLRLRGDRRGGLDDLQAKQYWVGDVDVSMAELLDRK
jgi:hypothetical protein